MRQQNKIIDGKTPETCCKLLSDVCARHPVDCENCINSHTCQQSASMRTFSDIIKSCPHFTPVPGWKLKARGKGSLDAY